MFVLVSAIKHDFVTNISYSRNISYQRLYCVLENLCGGVDSKTEPLIYWYNPKCVENVVMYLHDG